MGRTGPLALLALALAGCESRYEWNQKLTVVVATPWGERTGSAVTRVTKRVPWDIAEGFMPPEARGPKSRLAGEAVIVDVRPDASQGEPRYLFVLLTRAADSDPLNERDYADVLVNAAQHTVLPRVSGWGGPGPRYEAIQATRGTVHSVPREWYPTFATFTDLSVPSSIVPIDPDDLAATFGAGVRLEAVTMEVTDEPMTKGEAVKVLPWLYEWWGKMMDGGTARRFLVDNVPAATIGVGSFTTFASQYQRDEQ